MNMPPDKLEEEVLAIIAQKRNVELSGLTLDTTFAALGVDSLEAMDLIFTFEDRFQVDLPDSVALQMTTTVRQVIDALRPILSGEAAQVE